jgi:hypothetical protein
MVVSIVVDAIRGAVIRWIGETIMYVWNGKARLEWWQRTKHTLYFGMYGVGA